MNFTGTNTGTYRALPKPPNVQVDPFNLDWANDGKVVSSDPAKMYVIQYMGPANLGDDSNTTVQLGTPLIANQEGRLFRITAQGTSAKGTKRYVQTNLYIKNITGC